MDTPIKGVAPSDQQLYNTERYGLTTQPYLAYTFPIPTNARANGVRLRLHFAEIFDLNNAEGLRTFNVRVQSAVLLVNMDIYKEVGLFAPVVKEFVVTDLASGQLTITFEPPSNGFTMDGPKLSAVEVLML